jgi:ABC transporter substrate binding protein
LMAGAESDPQYQADVAVFRQGLQKLGWVDGQNIRIEVRWAGFNAETMRRYAKELIALQPDLILSHDTPTTATLLQQTRTVPIVFATVADPVGSGFVASFARPDGNATGFAVYEASLGGKWLELLKETVPNVSKVVVIFRRVRTDTAPAHAHARAREIIEEFRLWFHSSAKPQLSGNWSLATLSKIPDASPMTTRLSERPRRIVRCR